MIICENSVQGLPAFQINLALLRKLVRSAHDGFIQITLGIAQIFHCHCGLLDSGHATSEQVTFI